MMTAAIFLASALVATAPARRLPDGALGERAQVHHGLRVLGGSTATRTDAAGHVRWTRSSVRALPPGLELTPRIDIPGAELVVWALSDPPRLAWRQRLPMDRRRHQRWEVVTDAQTGAELGRRPLILRAAEHRARIYADNPIVTPDLAEVTLDRLAPGETHLTDPDLVATTCVDRRTCEVAFGVAHHACVPEQHVVASSAGDFLAVTPSTDPLDPGDLFAELSVYAHAAKALAFFRTLTDPTFAIAGGPVTLIANVQEDGEICDDGHPVDGSALGPFTNALFIPGTETATGGAQVLFGQGETVDFGLDGDVVYHELGHGLVTTLAPELGWLVGHPHGIDVTPAGLVEGLPDYLAAVLSGSSRIGEYVDASTAGPIIDRDLAGTARCPQDLMGVNHRDGLIVGGALWQARGALAENERHTFDRAVVTAIDALGADAGFEVFHDALIAELEVTASPATLASAREILGARGLDGCDGFVETLGPDDVHRFLFIGAAVGDRDVNGAPVQFRVHLDREAAALRVRFGSVDSDVLDLAIKPGTEAIRWQDGAIEAGVRTEEIITRGDFPTVQPFEREVAGPFPAGDVHLQFLVPQPMAISLTDVGIAPIDGTPAGPDGGGMPGDGGGVGAGGGSGGGGCRVARGDGGWPLALCALAVLLITRAARRRSA